MTRTFSPLLLILLAALAGPACVAVPEPAEAATVAGSFDDRVYLVETATSSLGSIFSPKRADILSEWTTAERTYQAGTDTGNVEDLVVKNGTITASSPVTVDLNGSADPSPLASNPAMTVLEFIEIENCNTSGSVYLSVTATLTILSAADVLRVYPGQKFRISTKGTMDGQAISAGSTDTVVMDASSATACYRFIAAGHH